MAHDALDGNHAAIAHLRTLTDSANPPWRFDMMPDVSFVLSSSAPILGIPTANGCDPMAPERIIQLRTVFSPGPRWGTCYQVKDPASPVLGLANVRYLLSRSEMKVPGLRLAADDGGYKIYENARALPRFFLADCVRPAADLSQASQLLRTPDFDPARCAIVEAPAGAIPVSGGAPGTVALQSYSQSRITLNVEAPADSVLITADSWYPGWRALVDGKPAPLYAADAAFRATPVPAGRHTVEMRFEPLILPVSGLISLVALLAALHFLYHGKLRPSWLTRVRAGQAKRFE